jgi:formiminotetrahydrofolate cyclodeaminase
VEIGNPNLITDVGCAAKFAVAALECAALNVEINLAYIKDEPYNAGAREELARLLDEGAKRGAGVWVKVKEKVRG